MKRMLSVCLCCISLLCLTSCGGSTSSVEYYMTKQLLEHDTGDINIVTYEYTDDWNVLSTKTYLNDILSSGVDYRYNEDSTLVTVTTTSSTLTPTVTDIHQEFDPSGRLLRATSYHNGNPGGTTEYTYDAEGREQMLVTTDPNGNRITTILYEYSKDGDLTSYTLETPAYITRNELSYDSRNRLSTTKTFRNDALTSRTEYTWEKNTRYGTVYDADNRMIEKNVAVYDEAGNVLIEERYDALGTLQSPRICYEYTGTDGSISSGIA